MNKSDLSVTEILLKEREELNTRIIEIERLLDDAGVDVENLSEIPKVSTWLQCVC
jgi:hypothetical protein